MQLQFTPHVDLQRGPERQEVGPDQQDDQPVFQGQIPAERAVRVHQMIVDISRFVGMLRYHYTIEVNKTKYIRMVFHVFFFLFLTATSSPYSGSAAWVCSCGGCISSTNTD